ncbi:MAG: hypothetical protein Q3979_00810 [Actinomycetaceae bacterium]|nr:hypothetical protein [Actinomycetaceae bacterium]
MVTQQPKSAGDQENGPGAATASAASSGAYVPNTTTQGIAETSSAASAGSLPVPVSASALFQLLSTERMATYAAECVGDLEQAPRLYAWNTAVSAAFWGSFNILEVTLRNALDHQLAGLAGRADWWHGENLLRDQESRIVQDAVRAAKRTHPDLEIRPGHTVAELTLGFWGGLLANRYHQRLWVPALHRAFPYWHESRRELHRRLESLRKLRNRVAYHEPIFARKLVADHDQLLDVLEGIAPEAAVWVRQNSRVPDVLSRRAQIISGSDTTTFLGDNDGYE